MENTPVKKKRSLIKDLLKDAVVVAIIFLIGHVIVQLAQPVVVIGSSMEPTYSNNDVLLINKTLCLLGKIDRFDIVVFDSEDSPNTIDYDEENLHYLVKRVVGLPGETVRIDENGIIFINDEPLPENYGSESILDAGIAENGVTLSEDEYFVLGDNRNYSNDSCDPSIGPISSSKLMGKVIFECPDVIKNLITQ